MTPTLESLTMGFMKPAALLALSLLASFFLSPAVAGPESLKVTFEAEKDRDKDKMTDQKLGEGDKIVTRYDFRFSVENLTTEACPGVEARVYVVVSPFNFKNENDVQVYKVLEKKDVVIDKQGTTKIEMGSVDLTITDSVKGNLTWHSGWKYQGYLAELSHGGQVFYTDNAGGGDTKRAVAAYLKNPSPKRK